MQNRVKKGKTEGNDGVKHQEIHLEDHGRDINDVNFDNFNFVSHDDITNLNKFVSLSTQHKHEPNRAQPMIMSQKMSQ
jgi:hypothetical protein